jgi:FlaA1/EpsC-like NDP-sugar epimerase
VSYKRSKNQQKEIRNDVLTTDSMVPIQQASNYLLFKADQVVIASNVLHFSPLQSFLPIDYLFYTKLIELFSGITTSVSPMISGFRFEEKSIWQFFKNKTYASLVIAAVFIQISVTLFLLKNPDKLHLLMLIPFVMTTILIVPVTLINFYYYRNNKLRKANVNNIISLITGAIIMALSVFIKSPLLFSFIVPAQLLLFILAYRFSMSRA